MADDDDDEVAIDEGMEPESPDGADPGESDDDYSDDDEDTVAAGGPVTRTLSAPRGTRPISDKVRELHKAAAAKMKAALAGDDVDPSDDDLEYDEAPTGAQITSPPAAAPVALGSALGVAPSQTAGAAPIPPSPQLDPEVTRLRDEWTAKSAQLDERTKKLEQAERSGDLAKLAEDYFERGAPAIVEILKKWEGVDGEELKDAIADLVSDLTIHMGVEVPTEIRDRLDSKRTRKQVKRMRSEQARLQQEQVDKQSAAQEAENRVRVKGILQQEIIKTEHAQLYPWLVAEENPGEIIVDVVDHALKKDGTQLTWQEAAKRANDYLKTQSSAWYDKRRHLFTTAPGNGSANGQKQQRIQGDPQVSRSQALPQKTVAAPPPALRNGKWDPEAHRRAVKAKHRTLLRNAFAAQDED